MNSTSTVVAAPDLPIFDADNATTAMHVRLEALEGNVAVFVQPVQAWQRGPHGGISVAATGPLLDAAVGSGAHLAAGGRRRLVMSSLTASFVAGLSEDDTVRAQAVRADIDHRTGTVSAVGEIHGNAGLIATVTCRAVPVERVPREPEPARPQEVQMTEYLDSTESRPFSTALGLRVQVSGGTHESLTGTWTTRAWMLNPFGTIQGGVVFAVVTEAAQIVMERLRGVDERIELTELSVDLLRSPHGSTTYDWTVTVLRSGRRMITMSVIVTDDSGREYARATCTAFRAPLT